jgi:hypothetical protein
MGRSPERRLLAAALVLLLFLGSSLAASAHWLTTPHRLCSFHGTIEHVSSVERGRVSPHDGTGPTYQDAGRGHEDCPFGPWARLQSPTWPSVDREWLPAHEARHAEACVPGDPLPEAALFLLAPSRSPPARA